jgi:hypothetical protein
MAIQSLQLICQYQSNHICEKAYKNKVRDFITINHLLTINKDLTYTSEKWQEILKPKYRRNEEESQFWNSYFKVFRYVVPGIVCV